MDLYLQSVQDDKLYQKRHNEAQVKAVTEGINRLRKKVFIEHTGGLVLPFLSFSFPRSNT